MEHTKWGLRKVVPHTSHTSERLNTADICLHTATHVLLTPNLDTSKNYMKSIWLIRASQERPWKKQTDTLYGTNAYLRLLSCWWTLKHIDTLRAFTLQQGKSDGFDSCDRPSNLTQMGFFGPRNLEIWWKTPKNNRARLLYFIKLCA